LASARIVTVCLTVFFPSSTAVFTIITFPFLFAVMFGDAGHGIILTILALYFILREDSLSRSNSLGVREVAYHFGQTAAKSQLVSQSLGILFRGRYLLFLMGIFSIYAGLLYLALAPPALPRFCFHFFFSPIIRVCLTVSI
jgi:V-type H+-transporting ATPase subunit a